MNRIVLIKKRLDEAYYEGYELADDIKHLLSKLEIAEKALGLIAELYVPFTNKEVVDTTNAIKEMASKAVRQLRE